MAREAGEEMDPADPIRSPDRLAALQSTALLDTPTEEIFDRLTRLISRSLQAPVALVTLVDADRQWFKSAVGLPEPLASQRQTPLSYSICQHVVASGLPLVIIDARTHPLVSTNPAVMEFGVLAYAGIPLVTSEGHTLGAFCAMDTQPRRWTAEELEILWDLAAAVMAQIELRRRARELQPPEQTASPAVTGEAIPEVGAAPPPVTPHSPARDGPLPARSMEAAAPTPFVDNVSGELRNELRNALNGIIGFSEVLADEIFGPLNSRQARYVQNILTSGRHLLQLLDDDPGAATTE
jgi:signal transduction protein with GAF and PtsI domain